MGGVYLDLQISFAPPPLFDDGPLLFIRWEAIFFYQVSSGRCKLSKHYIAYNFRGPCKLLFKLKCNSCGRKVKSKCWKPRKILQALGSPRSFKWLPSHDDFNQVLRGLTVTMTGVCLELKVPWLLEFALKNFRTRFLFFFVMRCVCFLIFSSWFTLILGFLFCNPKICSWKRLFWFWVRQIWKNLEAFADSWSASCKQLGWLSPCYQVAIDLWKMPCGKPAGCASQQ